MERELRTWMPLGSDQYVRALRPAGPLDVIELSTRPRIQNLHLHNLAVLPANK